MIFSLIIITWLKSFDFNRANPANNDKIDYDDDNDQ